MQLKVLLVLLAAPRHLWAQSQCNDVVLDENGKSYFPRNCLPQFRNDDIDSYYDNDDDVVVPPGYRISRAGNVNVENGRRFLQRMLQDRSNENLKGKDRQDYVTSGKVKIISARRERDPEVYLEKLRKKSGMNWKYVDEDVLRRLSAHGTSARREFDVAGGHVETETDKRPVDKADKVKEVEDEDLRAGDKVEGPREPEILKTGNASIADGVEESKMVSENVKEEEEEEVEVEEEPAQEKVVEPVEEIVVVDHDKVEEPAVQLLGNGSSTTSKSVKRKKLKLKGKSLGDERKKRKRRRKRRKQQQQQENSVALKEEKVNAAVNMSRGAEEVERIVNVNINENHVGRASGKARGILQLVDILPKDSHDKEMAFVETIKQFPNENVVERGLVGSSEDLTDGVRSGEDVNEGNRLVGLYSWKKPVVRTNRRFARKFNKQRSSGHRLQDNVSLQHSKEQLSSSRTSSSSPEDRSHVRYGYKQYPDYHDVSREASGGSLHDRGSNVHDSMYRKVLFVNGKNAGYNKADSDSDEDADGGVSTKLLEDRNLDWNQSIVDRSKNVYGRRFVKNIIRGIIDIGKMLVGQKVPESESEDEDYYLPGEPKELHRPHVELEYYWPS